ncbi:glycosyltransferase family 4 protein [Longitalea luteola]|uniref:glycosyltransferase family 4 protein n=1 Tax=Longitalea luteola TaxID=2812563 RepID=UPI001F61A429|nr:glycosyltransferase family 4 protein [Longitalea luteola]
MSTYIKPGIVSMQSELITDTTIDSVILATDKGNNHRKHKVLFVIDTLETGGAEQSLFANAIRFKNLQPVVCHLYAGEHLKQRFLDHGITVYSAGLKKKYGFFQAYKQLNAIVQKEQPDIIVAYLTRSELVARFAGRFNHIPVIGNFVSDLYSEAYNSALSWKAKMVVSFFKWANRSTARMCKGFMAITEVVKESNAKALGINVNKVIVIGRGRDSKIYRFRVPQITPGKAPRFLSVGRLVPVKGQRDLILAFSEFLPSCPQAVLHIAGDGPARKTLAALITELGLQNNVVLLGNRSDVPQLINEYDCFVFASHSEGFGGAILEAMFAGLPVLISDIPVHKELVTHLETGYFFETGSAQSIAQALSWYYNNVGVANAMAVKANKHAREHFELSAIAGKMEDYLLNMIITKN